MKMKSLKKSLALFLAFVMCLSLFPVNVFAADIQPEHEHGENCVWVEDDPTPICGAEEHQHTDACYTVEGPVLECVLAEHRHTAACESAPAVEPCALVEHAHGDECRDAEGGLVCSQEEHTHTDACAGTGGAEPCALPEHDHEDGCYHLFCTVPEHTHDGATCAPDEAGVCTLAEHTHSMALGCYVQRTLTCALNEHTHTAACYGPATGTWKCPEEEDQVQADANSEDGDNAPPAELPTEVQSFVSAMAAMPQVTQDNALELFQRLGSLSDGYALALEVADEAVQAACRQWEGAYTLAEELAGYGGSTYSITGGLNSGWAFNDLQTWINDRPENEIILQPSNGATDYWFAGALTIPVGKTVTVKDIAIRRGAGSGYEGPLFRVEAGATLNLESMSLHGTESDDKCSERYNAGNKLWAQGPLVEVSGTLNLNSGAYLHSNGHNGNGGGVYVRNGGTLNFNQGATIADCDAIKGGAVYVEEGGHFNENGGATSGCREFNVTGDDRLDGQKIVVTVLTSNNIPGEPAVSEYGPDHYHWVTGNYVVGGTDAPFSSNAADYISEGIFSDPNFAVNGGAQGVGSSAHKYLTGIDWDRVCEAVAEKAVTATDGNTLTVSNQSSYTAYPYVAKLQDDGWHIDCVIVPKNHVKLTYELNLQGYIDSLDGFEAPNGKTYVSGATVTVDSANYSNQPVKVGEGISVVKDGQPATLYFLGWSTEPVAITSQEAASYKKPGDTFAIQQDTTLYGVWSATYDFVKITYHVIFYRGEPDGYQTFDSKRDIQVDVPTNNPTVTLSTVPVPGAGYDVSLAYSCYYVVTTGSTELVKNPPADSPTDPPITVRDNNTIHVYYNAPSGQLRYNVEYWKVDDAAASKTDIIKVPDAPLTATQLDVDKTRVNTTDAFGAGYVFAYVGTEGSTIVPDTVAPDGTIKVYYRPTTATKSYTVNYYKGSTETPTESATVDVPNVLVDATQLPVQPNSVNTSKYADDGYVLDYIDTMGNTIVPSEVEVGGTINVYFKLKTTELTYTVEYYKDGVKADSESKTATATGNDTTASVALADTGITADKYGDEFTFEKLVVGDDEAQTSLPASVTVSNGITIKVYYVTKTHEVSYTVEYYKDGTIDNSKTQTVSVTAPATATELTVDTSKVNTTNAFGAGYAFAYVNTEDDTTVPDKVAVDGTIKVYYTAIVYRIDYELDGGTSPNPDNPASYTVNDTVTIDRVPTKANHTFQGWVLKNAGGTYGDQPSKTVTFGPNETGDRTYKAVWQEEGTYTLTVRMVTDDATPLELKTPATISGIYLSVPYTCTASDASFVFAAAAQSKSVDKVITTGAGDRYVYVIGAPEASNTGNADGVTVTLVYSLDNWHDGTDPKTDPDSPTGGDGIPDKYQALVNYRSEGNGTVSPDCEVFTHRNEKGELVESSWDVTLSGKATANNGYAFAYWTDEADTKTYNKALGELTVTGGEEYTYTATFLEDKKGGTTDPGKTPDGIPDAWQAFVQYVANGSGAVVVTGYSAGNVTLVYDLRQYDGNGLKTDAEGKPALSTSIITKAAQARPYANGSGWTYSYNRWALDGVNQRSPANLASRTLNGVVGGRTYTYTAYFNSNYSGGGGGGGTTPTPPTPPTPPSPPSGGETEINDPAIPLATAPGLNSTDHFAYVIGYEDGTVRPNANITRAEVATIFFRLMTDEFRSQNWATGNSFSDVNTGNWYNNAVSTAAKAGLVNGYPDGSFRPSNRITRAEFAAIAARFLSDDAVTAAPFADTVGHWAEKDITRAVQAGWIAGYPDGTFRPGAYITRAEVMTVVNRMLDRVPDKDHLLPDMVVWPDNPETAWYYEDVQEATNGHDYERDELGIMEIWTALEPVRDWAALETAWANANS